MSASTIAPGSRAQELFERDLRQVHTDTDRLFSWLLLAQWIAGIACALWLTPLAWAGDQSSVHPHVLAAVFLGGVITSLPFVLARTHPGAPITRHLIAAAQMLWAALLIDLTGGRLETHFHVFGSLAFIAFYRDWRVLATATAVVAVDHAVRGWFWPRSVFGPGAVAGWRWVEHAGWVLFEDAFLIPACLRGLAEMRKIAERTALLEDGKAHTELEVIERTRELTAANHSLAQNEAALRTANNDLHAASAQHKALHEKLVVASRMAGMAEVATGVLHNVGNVLNTVNVSARVLADRLHNSEVPSLARAAGMIRDNRAALGSFLETDDRGRHIPSFIVEVSECLVQDQRELESEVEAIIAGVEHIKQVVCMQQEHAKHKSQFEPVNLAEVVESALRLQQESLSRHGVEVVRSIEHVPAVPADKHRVLQILINLITNARQAMENSPHRRLTVTVAHRTVDGAPFVCIDIADSGVGIPAENLTRIFQHGFTTRSEGHGFGLHSAAVAAQALGGSLTPVSGGPGLGSTFTLSLPATIQPGVTAPSGELCTES